MKAYVLVLLLLGLTTGVSAREIALVRDGQPQAVVCVSPEIMDASRPEHALLRESVEDFVRCIRVISGATISIRTTAPADNRLVPILVGALARPRGGELPAHLGPQAWRLRITPQAILAQGREDEGASFALYEMLDRWGCRWYLPGELGENLPRRKTLTLAEGEVTTHPAVLGRCIGPVDRDYQRRNRCGGLVIECNDISINMGMYISRETLTAHPAWNAEIDGRRGVSGLFCWSHPEVAGAVAQGIIARLEKKYQPVVTLSQPYNQPFCECAECRKLDAGGWNVALNKPSMTDRYVAFGNRVAAQVTKRYPAVLFGMLVNMSYVEPPLREKPHPNLLPVVTSINTCRAHSLMDDRCPGRRRFRDILQGWGKVTSRLAVYEYAYNLAEVAAPYPQLRWIKDIPAMQAAHNRFWLPYGWVSDIEPNLEAALPGWWLGMRLSWYPQADPQQVVEDFYRDFYGSAATSMRRYWQLMDAAWQETPEHAGYFLGFDQRFPPETLKQARGALNDASTAAATAMEYRRVKLAEDCFRTFEMYMAMRRDLVAGRLTQLERDALKWQAVREDLRRQYRGNYSFSPYGSVAALPLEVYRDASRIARDYHIIGAPLGPWRWKPEGNESPGRWSEAQWDDSAWPLTDPAHATWASLGLNDFYGTVWYRTRVNIPAFPEGKRIFLWVSMADDTCRPYVNGKPVSWRDAKGEVQAAAHGYMQPFSFDVTSVLTPGSTAQITLAGTRSTLNELGTGGLLGPVLLYREK